MALSVVWVYITGCAVQTQIDQAPFMRSSAGKRTRACEANGQPANQPKKEEYLWMGNLLAEDRSPRAFYQVRESWVFP